MYSEQARLIRAQIQSVFIIITVLVLFYALALGLAWVVSLIWPAAFWWLFGLLALWFTFCMTQEFNQPPNPYDYMR